MKLVVSDEAKEFMIEKGSSTDYGARPLRRAVEQHLEDALSESLLRGEFAGKDTIIVKIGDGEDGEKKLVFETTSLATPAKVDEPAVATLEIKS